MSTKRSRSPLRNVLKHEAPPPRPLTVRLLSGRVLLEWPDARPESVHRVRQAVGRAEGADPESFDLVLDGSLLTDEQQLGAGSAPLELIAVRVQPFQILVASEAHAARLYSGVTGAYRQLLPGHRNAVKTAAFNPSGELAVSASDDFTVALFNVRQRRQLRVIRAHRNNVNSAVFSPGGGSVLTASDDGQVRLFSASGGHLWSFQGHRNVVNAAVFSPDGSRAVSASDDGTAKVLDARTGSCLTTIAAPKGAPARSVAVSPCSAQLALASEDEHVQLHLLASGELTVSLGGHGDAVCSVLFSPDGFKVVTACMDMQVRLFDVVSGSCERSFGGHSGFVNHAAFSPDGEQVVSACDDGKVRVFAAGTGSCQRVYEVGVPVRMAVFAPVPSGRVLWR